MLLNLPTGGEDFDRHACLCVTTCYWIDSETWPANMIWQRISFCERKNGREELRMFARKSVKAWLTGTMTTLRPCDSFGFSALRAWTFSTFVKDVTYLDSYLAFEHTNIQLTVEDSKSQTASWKRHNIPFARWWVWLNFSASASMHVFVTVYSA